jgi:hypothetical protein
MLSLYHLLSDLSIATVVEMLKCRINRKNQCRVERKKKVC